MLSAIECQADLALQKFRPNRALVCSRTNKITNDGKITFTRFPSLATLTPKTNSDGKHYATTKNRRFTRQLRHAGRTDYARRQTLSETVSKRPARYRSTQVEMAIYSEFYGITPESAQSCRSL